ncbi:MAG: NUDIX hydrolase [Alphaproteobacteria bacterium]|jgi:ADP-ribose pyrophosphatase YjhB (NUDIX family)|nr:NUDIX hydrolase [Alphaproteobacteria bacterium]MDP6516098.1 NUDIX hydrolase [Alphaproteobacteria bacterium]|tara:strand:+ start:1434 stop:1991 length:558 start_codon:yes stop_codon:yes gene_type:complete
MTTSSKVGAGPSVVMVPEGDNRPRKVCPDCGFIHYRNPLVVVGAVCVWRGRILLCRRAIAPRHGYWTLPAGYLELEETTVQGAIREVREEACAEIEIERLLGVYDIARISQVQLIYAARLKSDAIAPGVESLEVALFEWDRIPWDDLAFPSVRWALDHYREAGDGDDRATRSNPPGATGDMRRPG